MESLKQIQAIKLLKANINELQELAVVSADPLYRAKILLAIAEKQVRLDALQKTPKI